MNPITEHYAIYRGSLEYHHRHTVAQRPSSASFPGKVPSQQQTAEAPELRENITVDECKVLDLTVKTGEVTQKVFDQSQV
jgi:hypothetical protein